VTRLIIPVLVALLVSGPAWAKIDEEVLLRCVAETTTGNYPKRINVPIARDGSWIFLHQTKIRRKELPTPGAWLFEEHDGDIGFKYTVLLTYRTLEILIVLREDGKTVASFRGVFHPIKNPLKF